MCLKKKVYILLFGCSKSEYHIDSKAMTFLIEFSLVSERFSVQIFRELNKDKSTNS